MQYPFQPTEEFPYLQCFADQYEDFTLTRTTRTPVAINHIRGFHQVEQSVLTFELNAWNRDSRSEIVFDFGIETVGGLEIQVTTRQGTTVDLYYGEDLSEALLTEPYNCGWYTLPHDQFTIEPGTTNLVSPGRRSFRFVRILFGESAEDLLVSNIKAWHQHYPVKQRGHFNSSDDVLNRVWQISEHTTRCCMQQFYEDGVKRDGLLWVGDCRIQQMCGWMLYGDQALARKSLLMIASSQHRDGGIPACAGVAGGHQHPHDINYMPGHPNSPENSWVLINYCSDFVCAVREYVKLTEDHKTLELVYPFLTRCLGYLLKIETVDNLLPARDFITDNQGDTVGDWWASRGALVMQLIHGLETGAALVDSRGDRQLASGCEHTALKWRQIAITRYYEHRLELFTDEAADQRTHVETGHHVNCLAAMGGILPTQSTAQELLNRSYQYDFSRHAVCGMMKFYTTEALWRFGLGDQALQEVLDYYGYMLEQGASTCWEKLDLYYGERPLQNYPTSHCHGWSAGPAWQLPVHVLGVNPLPWGWQQIQINPNPGHLEWANGIIPTPHGNIAVEWEQTRSGNLAGRICLPVETALEAAPGVELRRLGAGEYALSRVIHG